MVPGAMQLARTPPPSSAIALVSATTPALAAAYAAEPRTPLSEAAFSAATFTMRPSPRIRRSAARQQRKQERRLMSTIFSNSSTEVCANGAPIQPPAQCTEPQIAPCCSRALSYAASTCASTERSCLRVRATTLAPLRCSRSTTAAPRFPEAPVTTTQRRSSVDMAAQSTQNGAADARPRSSLRRRALRRAAGAHAGLRRELALRPAGAEGDSGAAARAVAIRRRLRAADDHAAAGSPARTTAPAPRGVEEAFLPLPRRRSGEPGFLPLRPAALDGLARGAALHADAALRAAPRARADR